MNSGVYEIVNLVNGKRYIGSAVDFRTREHNHFSTLRRGTHRNPHLQAAFVKYGKAAFRFVAVLECSPDQMVEEEQRRIEAHDPCQLYNIRKEAQSNLGLKHTEEARRRIGVAHKGKAVSDDTRAKISAAKRGRKMSDEFRMKMAAALAGRSFTELHRAKLAEAGRGKRHSEESKQRMAEARRGKTDRALPFPSFVDPEGRIYPSGVNLAAFCRDHSLNRRHIQEVILGKRTQHRGWRLAAKD